MAFSRKAMPRFSFAGRPTALAVRLAFTGMRMSSARAALRFEVLPTTRPSLAKKNPHVVNSEKQFEVGQRLRY